MEYTTTLEADEPIAITIGNFDGIHRGHQQLLHELGKTARSLQSKPVIVTFSPHTLMVVRPDIYVRYLTTLEEKLTLAHHYGAVKDSIVIYFTPAVVAMSATEFMDILRTNFRLKALVVGENFSLGHNRKGDVAFLQKYGQEHGILVQAIPLEEAEHTRISSTRIRTLVTEGAIGDANALLGHPMLLTGIVSQGNKRGRQLGFPTANIAPDPHKLLPADGVYAVRTHVQKSREGGNSDAQEESYVYKGVANIGVRPTFNGTERLVEVYLLDVDLDLYDKELCIDFIAHLRDERRFPGIDALKKQITTDVQQARQILESNIGA
ncbi:MAG: bifunctional riboflavin kinase/FAD synthetase [Ktedonobacteraceae bacterium]|nr:bifunctional riboflavin kinase/FAD synthetase [Ktedonobacteraceae bacterium]